MRVVVDYRPALRGRTGVGQYVFEVLRALGERQVMRRDNAVAPAPGSPDIDITALSSSWKDRPLPADIARLPGVHLIDRRLPVAVLNLAWHRLGWPPVELVAGGGFDVAFSPHPLLLPARHAAQVVMIHDLDFLAHPERTVREIRRDYPQLVRDHAHRAAHVVVPSHYTARHVENELGLAAGRMTVCYPGAPEWRTGDATSSVPPERRHVLFVGTLEERKNIGTLLGAYQDVLSLYPDAPPLVLAGGSPPEAARWLERIAQPPLAGHVRYEGYVPEERRRSLFESAALFVLPSLEEGFGMPALEAMAAGVPVIVSNRGALPEVVDDAGLIVNPDDQEGLAGAMERVLTDDAFSSALAAKGRQRARRFRWADTAESLVKAFERALEAKPR